MPHFFPRICAEVVKSFDQKNGGNIQQRTSLKQTRTAAVLQYAIKLVPQCFSLSLGEIGITVKALGNSLPFAVVLPMGQQISNYIHQS
jgi:hypothetical protein